MKRLLALLAVTTAAMAQPAITAVLDGAALTNNIAQGSVFIVKGTGLSSAGYIFAPAPLYPITVNNVKISMTAVNGGTVVTPLMVYTYNLNGVNQVEAVLPSTTAVGAYDLRVINGAATSAAFRTSVVARKPGIVTASSDGLGPAQATLAGQLILQRTSNLGKIGDYASRPAHPGERVDLWGTGLGPDVASDTGGTGGDQTAAASIKVIINGTEITPIYAGRSQGYPGLDQIVFTLPATTALNCTVDVQVRSGDALSNPTTIATGTADTCPATSSSVRFNEVESNGGTPGDWAELYNSGTTPVTLTGYVFKDNDDTHNYTLPTTILAANGYLVLNEADFTFGLGAPDAVRLYRPDGTLADSYVWTTHAITTYGRCPNITGVFATTNNSTKGAANDCGSPIKINEVESDAGVPGDWVELYNPTSAAVSIAGFTFRDNDDSHSYIIPAGTTVPATGYLVLDEASFVFGLGSADSARLFDTNGVVVDSYTWTAHATTTYGRCPNGTGDFATTAASTKGAANSCTGDAAFAAWPGGTTILAAGPIGFFTSNLSGLMYEGTGTAATSVLWGIKNGPGTLYRLVWNGTIWTADTTNNWAAGKALRYPDGTGDPDSEGVTYAGTSSAGGIYVSTERNNSANGVSRLSVLRFDPAATGATLTATHEWNLTADLPAVGANLGLEAITWLSDTFLTSKNFFDEAKGHTYNPAEYPNHGTGLFFVGLEANGMVYAYALDQGGTTYTRLATITTGLAGVMDLEFDRDLNDLWAVCDDTCQGRSVVLRVDATTGKFAVARRFERPTGMPNINNEGFAIAPASQCTNGTKPVFWSDDSEDDGQSLRSGTLTCTAF